MKADVVFLSPPWGGPDYLHVERYYINMMPLDGERVLRAALSITPNVAFLLPRNCEKQHLATVASGKVSFVFAYAHT